jgi:hypothetical protein
MQVLIVESHKGKFNARQLSLLYTGFGWTQAKFTDLLPVGIGGLTLAYSWDLQDLGAQIALPKRNPR